MKVRVTTYICHTLIEHIMSNPLAIFIREEPLTCGSTQFSMLIDL